MREIGKLIFKGRITFVFAFFYVVVNAFIWAQNGYVYPPSKVSPLWTSWFNPTEDWGKTSFIQGVLTNFFLVLGAIAFAEYYARIHQQKIIYGYLSVDVIFVIGVSSTYIVSWVNFPYLGYYNSGSSILAFTFILTYCVYFWLNLFHYIAIKKNGPLTKKMFVFTLLPCILYLFGLSPYYLGNKFHYIGLEVFFLLLVITLPLEYLFYQITNKKIAGQEIPRL